MHAKRLDELRRQLADDSGLFARFRRRRAASALLSRGSPGAIRHLLLGLAQGTDDALRQDVLDRLRDSGDRDRIDAICAAWAETRHPDIARLLTDEGWVAREPMPVRVLSALKAEQAEAIAPGGAEVVPPLLEAARDQDADLAEAARRALRRLSDSDARAAVCDAAIDAGDVLALQAAVDAGHAATDPHRRAVFHFLAGQWEPYESLDFDGSILRGAYAVAPADLRARLAASGRRAGRVEFVDAAAGGRQGRRLGEMTDAEWEAAVAVLAGGDRGEELWQLARVAPPRWGARILRGLARAGWRPMRTPEDAADFARLAELAAGWVDPETGSAVAAQLVLRGHARAIAGLAFTPDGSLLASIGRDQVLRLWSLPDGHALVRQTGQPLLSLAISPNGQHLATGGDDGSIRLWSLPDGRQRERLTGPRSPVTRLGVYPDGRTLVTAHANGTMQLWALPGGREIRTLKPTGDPFLIARATAVDARLAVSPDAAAMAFGLADGQVMLWSRLERGANASAAATAAALAFRSGAIAPAPAADSPGDSEGDTPPAGWVIRSVLGKGFPVRCLAFPPTGVGGLLLAVGGDGGNLLLWHAAKGTTIALPGHASAVGCIAPSGEGRLLASGDDDGVVRLWSLPDGRPLQTLAGHDGAVRHVAFSPARGLLASGGADGVVRIWGAQSLRLSRLPVNRMTLLDLTWITETLNGRTLTPAERGTLAFIGELLRLRHREDVIVSDVGTRVEAGEFDIEIGE